MASVLAATSNPTRTSPVKRGKWILDNILGVPPAPPPSGVESLREGQAERGGRTLRAAVGAAQEQSLLRQLSSAYGSAGLRPGEL